MKIIETEQFLHLEDNHHHTFELKKIKNWQELNFYEFLSLIENHNLFTIDLEFAISLLREYFRDSIDTFRYYESLLLENNLPLSEVLEIPGLIDAVVHTELASELYIIYLKHTQPTKDMLLEVSWDKVNDLHWVAFFSNCRLTVSYSFFYNHYFYTIEDFREETMFISTWEGEAFKSPIDAMSSSEKKVLSFFDCY